LVGPQIKSDEEIIMMLGYYVINEGLAAYELGITPSACPTD
jgi:hypothetical protein